MVAFSIQYKYKAVKKMIGEKLMQLRKQKGYSLRKLAEITGLSHSFISDIEHKKSSFSFKTLLSLSKALEVKPEFFLAEMVANHDRSTTTDTNPNKEVI